jgi:hypothetical protein
MQTKDTIWFPARKYGYGWGFPRCRQGWIVLAVYWILLGAGAVALIGTKQAAYFVLYLALLSVALVGVCTWKGEALRWRWGGK